MSLPLQSCCCSRCDLEWNIRPNLSFALKYELDQRLFGASGTTGWCPDCQGVVRIEDLAQTEVYAAEYLKRMDSPEPMQDLVGVEDPTALPLEKSHVKRIIDYISERRRRESARRCFECGSGAAWPIYIPDKPGEALMTVDTASVHPGCGGRIQISNSDLRIAFAWRNLPLRVYDLNGCLVREVKA